MSESGQVRGTSAAETGPVLARTILVLAGVFIVVCTAEYSNLISIRNESAFSDFETFHMVGEMIWEGSLEKAYHYESMFEAQERLSGAVRHMLWSYPPPFNLLVAPLALVSLSWAYFLFVSSTFIVYALVLRALSGRYYTATLLAISPAIFVTIKSGQNGFLMSALCGLFCLTFLRKTEMAGLPLGLMVIKPHVSVGLWVLSLAGRRWGTLLTAVLVAGVVSAMATLAFGFEVWSAFARGAEEAGIFLRAGLYPLFRMTSIYASLFTLGVPGNLALSVQSICAALACFVVVLIHMRGWRPECVLGVSALMTLCVSPYNYDYDMPILGIGIALLSPHLVTLGKPREKIFLLVLAWITCGWGLLQSFCMDISGPTKIITPDQMPHSFAGICYLIFVIMTLNIVRRKAVLSC